ncbi:hypothetical protein AB0G04_27255 [Actinoplanes sp. NPDC023801]|uniref:hypothetical protein n=1 Tax=Actinoplanes sp. NPDC023801 TaxID=3154595 RepID=UPI0033D88F5D
MIDGRIFGGGKDLGSAFALTDRIVATAAHVVRKREPGDLTFITAGSSVQVEDIQIEPKLDAAVLRVAESLAIMPSLAHAAMDEGWSVTARPKNADSRLTGAVTAVDHLIQNAGGHEMNVLQLDVTQKFGDFSGYSGSAVVVRDSIVGLLVEQVKERTAGPGAKPRAANVLYAVPVDRLVARFRLGLRVERQPGPKDSRQLLNTAYFDLDRLKNAILDARATVTDRFLSFGIPVQCTDMKVVDNLRDWLPSHLGEFAPKGQITLRPEVNSVERAVSYVVRYRAELERVNVFCPILADGVSPETVSRFINEVRAALGRHRRWMFLLLVGEPAGGFPDPVAALPLPSFAPEDVGGWAYRMVALRRWPKHLAPVWRDRIVDEVGMVDGLLDVRATYEVLEDHIGRVCTRAEELKRELEDMEAW